MTVAVIGIALALPAGLQALISNTRSLSGAWEGAARISVYLKQDQSTAAARALADELKRRDDVADVRVISPDQAMNEFRRLSGFGDALKVLDSNPLPAVLVVQPADAYAPPAVLQRMVDGIGEDQRVDMVQLDAQWLRRLHAILEIARRAVLVLAALFAVGVIIIVGNTIRLDIENRRPEIEVTKLIGGTDAFIRRPFLYTGLWYGIGGGMMAWLLVSTALWLMQGPVARLSGLYGSEFQLSGLDGGTIAGLFAAGALLGWLGSWVAVARHLSRIEPA
jgi:cell division transport system permease protein